MKYTFNYYAIGIPGIPRETFNELKVLAKDDEDNFIKQKTKVINLILNKKI